MERLHPPPVPYCFERHMGIWQELHAGRQAGWGLAPISWQDMMAFCHVTGERLNRDDVQIIREIEGAFFASREAAEQKVNQRREAADARNRTGH